jgi:RimJ/RimL family protein N-acetyltransferase
VGTSDAADTDRAGGVVDTGSLPDGRRLIVRLAARDDAGALLALYRRLSRDDLWLRFFTAASPSPTFVDHWADIAADGGLLLVVEVEERSGTRTLIAEAGYSRLPDGDGELGITVDPSWRGGIGPWLLAVLLREAAARGVPNLEAIVQMRNDKMLAMLRHRGAAVVEQESFDDIRLVIGTDGPVPSWPKDDPRPRILVEAAHGAWAGERAARAAGFDVRTCRGPRDGTDCPLLRGDGCPLVDGADAVVTLLPAAAAHTGELIALHDRNPEVLLVVPAFGAPGEDPCETAPEVVERIRRTLGLA